MQSLLSSALWLLGFVIITILIILGLVKLLFRKLDGEKLTTYLDFTKWIVVSVALVIIASVVDSAVKDREQGLAEVTQYGTHVQLVIQADGIGQRWRLAQYFSKVTASEKLKARWNDYYEIVEKEYLDSLKKQADLFAEARRLDSLSKLPGGGDDSVLQKQLKINNEKIQTLTQDLNTSNWSTAKADVGAAKFERQGFEFLLQKDVEGAITAFNNAEQNTNGYHMVYDIWNYLRKNKSGLNDPANTTAWRKAYSDILSNFSWKMPADIKEQMSQVSNN